MMIKGEDDLDAVWHIEIGTISLIVCCLIYLAWWSIAFHPLRQYPFAPKVVLFVLTALAGAVGIVFLVWGTRSAPASRDGISNAVIIIRGIAAYVLLLFLTSKLFHRTVTTEPYPGRWTTHIVIGSETEIDDELFSWVSDAYRFAEEK